MPKRLLYIHVFLAVIIAAIVGVLGYAYLECRNAECDDSEDEATEDTDDDAAGLANPASVYCEEQGGEVDLRESSDGVVGYCVFDDGSECEEWAYYRGECAPVSTSN